MIDRDSYKKQLDKIEFSEYFEEKTIALMKQHKKERFSVNSRFYKTAVAAVVVLTLSVSTVFAAVAFLSPSQVADRFGMSDVAKAFTSDGAIAINESAVSGDYRVTLLGMASGEKLDRLNGVEFNTKHSYIAAAVERTDGQPLDHTDSEPLSSVILVDGYAPWQFNSWMVGLGYSTHRVSENGVLYYIIDSTDIELFADHDLYLMFFEGFAPSFEVFSVDDNGHISYAEGYTGARVKFKLPIDPSKADSAAADALLQRIYADDAEDEEGYFSDSTSYEESPDDFATPTTATRA